MPSEETLATLLRRRSDEVLARWKQRVTGVLIPEHARPPEILDGLPRFIDQLAGDLAEGAPRAAASDIIATDHGTQRFQAGFSIGAVVREYQVLQDCIFELAREHRAVVSMEELRFVAHRMSAAVATAIEQNTRERDAAITRERNKHIGFIAHEVRNHISTASFSIEMLRRQLADVPPELERAQRAMARVQRLIDEAVFDVRLRTLSGGPQQLRLERLDLRELLREAIAEVSDEASYKPVRLLLDEGPPIHVEVDRIVIQSVLSNLVRNAVKFTRAGGTVEVQARTADGRAGVSVEDECGGLPEGRAEELFLPFIQKGKDRSGYGLGLAIAKQAIEGHGGTIQVRNLPGAGCVFSVDFPTRAARSDT
jgi:signal transduction histidine kinase